VKQRLDGFAVAYAGYLTIPSEGTYAFALTSCDGSRLFVNSQLVVDNDGQHVPIRREGTMTLEAGLQP
jgi:hypothetical protein